MDAVRAPPVVPDELDLMILEHMAKDANIQFKQLAEMLKVDQRTIAKRVNEMKEKGIFKSKIEIDWSRLGLSISAYVGVETSLGENAKKMNEYIKSEPRVIEAYSTIGDQEYFFRVMETDLQRLREGVMTNLEPITAKLTSSIISSQIKQRDDVALIRFLKQIGFTK